MHWQNYSKKKKKRKNRGLGRKGTMREIAEKKQKKGGADDTKS